jgi:hypothetical protein
MTPEHKAEKPLDDRALDRLVRDTLQRETATLASAGLAARIAEQAMAHPQDRQQTPVRTSWWQQMGIKRPALMVLPSAAALAASAALGFMLGAGTLVDLGTGLPIISDQFVDPLESTELALNWQMAFGEVYQPYAGFENTDWERVQ